VALAQFPECQATLARAHLELRDQTRYAGLEEAALRLLVENGQPSEISKEIESLLVLALWATFERFLRDYLREKGMVLKQQHLPFANSLYEHFENSVEWWKPADILALLKHSSFPNSTLLGNYLDQAGRILEHRNNVAHANPKKKTTRVGLEVTYNTLNEIIEILLQY
jgi:3-methyladenine DNA glycosylase AlkD